jgi:hypothetical protein
MMEPPNHNHFFVLSEQNTTFALISNSTANQHTAGVETLSSPMMTWMQIDAQPLSPRTNG